MNRILDLQKLDSSMDDGVDVAKPSTSSWIACDCSTYSQSACTPPKEIISI
jgi:hypothetical protein